MFKKSIFYFRNDLRIEDNIGFINCYENTENIIPIYIFENDHHKDFILNILNNLNKKINISIYFGNPKDIFLNILDNSDIDSIFFNCEYNIYSKIRDNDIIQSIKQKHNITIQITEDSLLTGITKVLNDKNNYYKNYTKFYNNIKKNKINEPKQIEIDKNKTILLKSYNFNINKTNRLADRNTMLFLLQKINKKTKSLSELKLSILLTYGLVSVRELFYSILTFISSNNIHNINLINELYRREFYYYIAFYDNNFIKKEKIDIKNENFKKWATSNTNIPIVDAGMKQLNTMGIIDNHMKIILASYLVKELKVDWRLGEYYFSYKLLDYDIILNNALWQYINGFDINPSFRYVNYEIQSKLYDHNCKYIKKYLPKLKNKPNHLIHKMN